ncbi:MAG: hypothetical protein HZY76_07820 [Anaerolineae bacterium]|nr:MAG: hypothetical protein HZY76_07820 [Anaerolineae bacterium]
MIAAAEALREPIQDVTTGRRELTVKPTLDAFNPIPYGAGWRAQRAQA